MQTISIINKTMELADCKNDWFFDEKFGVWCLEDILYTPRPTTPKFQRMSIFVPKAYMSTPGVINPEGEMNGYTTSTAPIVFENNSAGYMQMPAKWLGGPRCNGMQYLQEGFIYVTCGNRGGESREEKGELCGKNIINLIDLKMALRFLRHNRKSLPGDFNRIVSVGWSAGGAMSMLLGTTGNNKNFDEALKAEGAFMDESDSVFASNCYCPIIDLEHADLAYEWMFHEAKQSEDSPAGPAEVMSPFKDALSQKLKDDYIAYFNAMKLTDPEGKPLTFGKDGRSGSAYDYLMALLNESAAEYLTKLEKGGFERAGEPHRFTPEQYIMGEYETLIPMMGPEPAKKEEPSEEKAMQGFAGAGVELNSDNKRKIYFCPNGMPEFSLGELVSRPEKSPEGAKGPESTEKPEEGRPPMIPVKGKDKTMWLAWDGTKATVKNLDTFILNHRGRMKGCTSFDTLDRSSGECRLFGSKEESYKHFNPHIARCLNDLKDQYPEEYSRYYPEYQTVLTDETQKREIYLINPLNYIGTAEKSDQAVKFRIRVGTKDADTSFTIAMTAALKLQNAGHDVDYRLVWDMPHSEADYDGDIVEWIKTLGTGSTVL